MVENKIYVKHQIHKLVSSDSGMLCISFLVSKAIPSFIISTLPEKTSPFAHSFSVVSELLWYVCSHTVEA